MQRTAIVTGLRGQDASYLCELLLEKDYKVYGFKRRSSDNNLGCSEHLSKYVEVVEGDLLDQSSLLNLCKLAKPNEFYNLAAQSHVGTSFTQPVYTLEATGLGTLNCLEAIRQSGFHTRFYQASTSEMFGGMRGEVLCDEKTIFHPRSPYGCAKLYAHWITINYRESYKMFTACGILFNHESNRRGPNFVTRKITLGIKDILIGKAKTISLGNIDAKRDWGHAKDYVDGMWRILNHNHPDEFVLATGETHSVREFCKIAFEVAGLGSYESYITIDPALYRPAEVDVLLGDASKARSVLGWKPQYTFESLVKDMVLNDIPQA
jgi:GDPmannose 4,6-dehydratase